MRHSYKLYLFVTLTLFMTYVLFYAGLATVILGIVIVLGVAIIIKFCIYRRRTRAKRVLFAMNVNNLDGMDGISFEHFLCDLFTRLGYTSEATQASGDYGVDVLLVDKKGRRIAVQAKHYQNPVRLSAVQEVHTGISFYKASEGWVVTNSTFTKSAKSLAEAAHIRLIDGAQLQQLIARADDSKIVKNNEGEKINNNCNNNTTTTTTAASTTTTPAPASTSTPTQSPPSNTTNRQPE